jgi:hypothetical protein
VGGDAVIDDAVAVGLREGVVSLGNGERSETQLGRMECSLNGWKEVEGKWSSKRGNNRNEDPRSHIISENAIMKENK